jgi:hypothetical protein
MTTRHHQVLHYFFQQFTASSQYSFIIASTASANEPMFESCRDDSIYQDPKLSEQSQYDNVSSVNTSAKSSAVQSHYNEWSGEPVVPAAAYADASVLQRENDARSSMTTQ